MELDAVVEKSAVHSLVQHGQIIRRVCLLSDDLTVFSGKDNGVVSGYTGTLSGCYAAVAKQYILDHTFRATGSKRNFIRLIGHCLGMKRLMHAATTVDFKKFTFFVHYADNNIKRLFE